MAKATKRTKSSDGAFSKAKRVTGLPGKKFEATDRWIKLLLPLKKSRGAWHQIGEYPTASKAASVVQYLKREESLVPPGKWEFASRTLENDGGGLFARFLG